MMMKLGEAMFELATIATTNESFDKWVLEKRACLDKSLIARFTKELTGIKKIRKSKKFDDQYKLHLSLVFIFFWEARDDWRVENFCFQMAHATIMFMQQTSFLMPSELGKTLSDFNFLEIYLNWANSVLKRDDENDMENDGKSIGSDGWQNSDETDENDFEGIGEF